MSNAKEKFLKQLEAQLTKEDWKYIHHATSYRFDKATPKPSEGKPSKEFLDQRERIMLFLQEKAY